MGEDCLGVPLCWALVGTGFQCPCWPVGLVLWRGKCLWMRNVEGRENEHSLAQVSSCAYGFLRRFGGWGPGHSSLEFSRS